MGFSMKKNETIVEIITRFIDIDNGLEALGKTYKESEKVMKILRSLPSKWHTKVTAIQEAKDLTKLPMEELSDWGSIPTSERIFGPLVHFSQNLVHHSQNLVHLIIELSKHLSYYSWSAYSFKDL